MVVECCVVCATSRIRKLIICLILIFYFLLCHFQSPKFAPPIEFVDQATLSPPEGYKDGGLLDSALSGALGNHVFGAQHIQQLQVIQRLQQQRAAMLAARAAAANATSQASTTTTTTPAVDPAAVCTECAECAECAAAKLAELEGGKFHFESPKVELIRNRIDVPANVPLKRFYGGAK
jgi:hypothetical protein